MNLEFSQAAARHLHLAAQGLLRAPRSRADKAAVLAAIRNMGVLQIDTISVVARSPYLVLWSRLGDYSPAWLDELLAEAALFEYWAHEACFVPIEDYRWFRHRMLDPAMMGWKSALSWQQQHPEQIAKVMQHIRLHGATRSNAFEREGEKGDGWWDWKPEKRALEVLFTNGELMIARREAFQRVYDLRERILPDWDDTQAASSSQAQQHLVLRAIHALGLAHAGWVGDYFRSGKPKFSLDALVEQGLLLAAKVEGFTTPFYVHPQRLELAQQAAQMSATHTCVLSPFDPVVWDRKRALELFDFSYRLECYTPSAKRQYGYFSLPILRRGQLIGRVDAKAHRREGIFALQALYLEPQVKVSASLARDLAQSFWRCARWHACHQLRLDYCNHSELARLLQDWLLNQRRLPEKDEV